MGPRLRGDDSGEVRGFYPPLAQSRKQRPIFFYFPACRVGKGGGTTFNTKKVSRAPCPPADIDGSCSIHGGHGARWTLPRGNAVPAPLPTLQAATHFRAVNANGKCTNASRSRP